MYACAYACACMWVILINLDGAVNSPCKDKGGEEADCPCHEEHCKRHDGRVAKVNHNWDWVVDFELCEKVKRGVRHDVECTAARHVEAPPPPLVVLSAKLHVSPV